MDPHSSKKQLISASRKIMKCESTHDGEHVFLRSNDFENKVFPNSMQRAERYVHIVEGYLKS